MEAKRLSPQQRNLVKNLIKGMTLTDAALKAGYSEKAPAQTGHNALKAIRKKMPDIMERQGLSDNKLIRKYLKPALEAANTRRVLHVFQETEEDAKSEEVIEEQKEPAWDARLKALDMAFKLKGSYAPTEVEHTGNIIHEITELERNKAKSSLAKIQALTGMSETPLLAEYVDESTNNY